MTTQPTFSHSDPVKLFDLSIVLGPIAARTWDVSRDGKRFIAIRNDATVPVPTTGVDRPSFVFIVGFTEELRNKLGVNR